MDLKSQLAFYKYYHYNKVNIIIHTIFIPTILFSGLAILSKITILGVKANNLLAILYSLFYIYLCIPAGIIFSGIFIVMNTAISNGALACNKRKWGLFILGWIIQFIGHYRFEKDKPALFDNLIQSLVLAPYFVLFELLFKIGLYKDLNKEVEKEVKLRMLRTGKPIPGSNNLQKNY